MDADEVVALDIEAATRLADYAERPRIGDWTLRSALVRHAQRAPVAASAVLELIRRTDGALHPYRRALERTAVADIPVADGSPPVVELLLVAAILDELGEALAAWADDRAAVEPPDAAVDDAAGAAFRALASLGVPRETRPPRRAG